MLEVGVVGAAACPCPAVRFGGASLCYRGALQVPMRCQNERDGDVRTGEGKF